jgi:hypothetical protein
MLAPERANGFTIAPVNSTDVTMGIVAHGDAHSSFTVRVRSSAASVIIRSMPTLS